MNSQNEIRSNLLYCVAGSPGLPLSQNSFIFLYMETSHLINSKHKGLPTIFCKTLRKIHITFLIFTHSFQRCGFTNAKLGKGGLIV